MNNTVSLLFVTDSHAASVVRRNILPWNNC